jgi:nucleoside phosphorylase
MIRFVVALAPEAEPLVRHYWMEEVSGSFRTFRSERAALVVSGVGKVASSAATAFLHARTGEAPLGVWLNVGIAGHGARPPGDALLAHTVRDAATGERWYPARLGGPSIDAAEVRTVDRPETVFESDAAYDMEASGFYPTALSFSTGELVQSLKIVSDNRETGRSTLAPAAIRALVATRVELAAEVAEHLARLAAELDPVRRERGSDSLVDPFRRRWRLGATESRKLRRLLARWKALEPEAEHGPAEVEGAADASELIGRLEERLDRLFRERPL